LRAAGAGTGGVPKEGPRGSGSRGGVQTPEPGPGAVPDLRGLPGRVGGGAGPLRQWWHRAQAGPVPAGRALPLPLSLLPSTTTPMTRIFPAVWTLVLDFDFDFDLLVFFFSFFCQLIMYFSS
jgi:hypothetical protein